MTDGLHQATASRQGAGALFDSGVELDIAPEVLARSVFRFLRTGQRLQLRVRDGSVVEIGLPGRPL